MLTSTPRLSHRQHSSRFSNRSRRLTSYCLCICLFLQSLLRLTEGRRVDVFPGATFTMPTERGRWGDGGVACNIGTAQRSEGPRTSAHRTRARERARESEETERARERERERACALRYP